MSSRRVVIAGGTGFVGRHVAKELAQQEYDVTILSRGVKNDDSSYECISWDGSSVSDWKDSIDGAHAVINLSGRNINCRQTQENRKAILDSRVQSTYALVKAVADCTNPPECFVQASAVGYYGDTAEQCTEEAKPGTDFLPEVCVKWESALVDQKLPRTRKIVARLGVVLGTDGGAFPILYRLVKSFLGGQAGSGSQYMSWIHVDDLARIFSRVLEDSTMEGAYNAVSPSPATNAEFMLYLRKALHRPWSPPVPAPMIRLGCLLTSSNPEVVLTGQNVRPNRLLQSGFGFEHGDLAEALGHLCGMM